MSHNRLDRIIRGASVITGDGATFHGNASIGIGEGRIVFVQPGNVSVNVDEVEVIDAHGHTVIPGVINAHAHGCVSGPSMPSGSFPVDRDAILWNRNRHLLEGTTTLLNVCGLALPEEAFAGNPHPLDVHISTAHTPSNIEAALTIDGAGLSERHRHASIDDALSQGAKALGEVGGGQTLGGGAQEYRFIPEAMKRVTGREVSPLVSRQLRNAVVGRYLRVEDGVSDGELQAILDECGLSDVYSAQTVRQVILACVMPSVALALGGFEEVARESARVGFPAIFHNSAPSVERLIEIAEKYPNANIVAGHSNHPMFLPEESVSFARELRRRGVTIDVSTLDSIQTRWRNNPENFDALIEAGCVDTISTDYAGGHWDSILVAIQRIIHKKQMSPVAAVALATGNVARAFPQLAGDRGLIEKGRRADLVIVDRVNLGRVRHVIIHGKVVVWNGTINGNGSGTSTAERRDR
ncbi:MULTISPECIES: amidohydrolase family protein [Rhizobium/Agrobacterium group]|uniref:amidohydrolase family protein n=1 Tax=Rhizobium/Agrobacterium group TaxID=227290 RepID=UPI00107F43F9|nr:MULTISPECIES: amidohydrolase family protein [Rhizobium/Agrobacterium group]MBB4403029.1 putative amidohydrolase [Agrobacterium radiobacter]MBB5589061.1 putative amidohydrolase [Agrobacterium radiobacter]TGE86088.1 amidohydrolase [Rhizobium sp. SEMIA 4032]